MRRRAIAISTRIYRLLVACYPHDFRKEYGEPMVSLFDDQCRLALRKAGLFGLASLWLRTVGDYSSTMLYEYKSEWRQTMHWKNKGATVAGVLLLLYAISFAAINTLIYNFGLSNLRNPYSAWVTPIQPTLFSRMMEGLLILSPALALALLLMPLVELRLDWHAERWVTLTLNRGSRLSMGLIGLCLLIGLTFGLYFVGENFACLVGQQPIC